MLIPILDAETGNTIFVNPSVVNVVFTGKAKEGGDDVTVVVCPTGNIVTNEPLLEVVGRIQGELNG
jgi:hypothetical protein